MVRESSVGSFILDLLNLEPDEKLITPETCSLATWLKDGECSLQFSKLGDLFGRVESDITLRYTAIARMCVIKRT